jgi:hypothetical protein
MKAALTLMTIATMAISSTLAIDPYINIATNITGDPIDGFSEYLKQNNNTVSWAPQVKYLSSLARGFIQGYRRGMYKDNNYRVSASCFDRNTTLSITKVFDSVTTLNFDVTSSISEIIYALKSIADNCDYDESLYDYLSYCYEGDMCEPQNMLGTLLKKVFQVTTIANDLAQVYAEGLPNDQSSSAIIEDFGERMGANVGKLLRYATEFDPNIISNSMLYE